MNPLDSLPRNPLTDGLHALMGAVAAASAAPLVAEAAALEVAKAVCSSDVATIQLANAKPDGEGDASGAHLRAQFLGCAVKSHERRVQLASLAAHRAASHFLAPRR